MFVLLLRRRSIVWIGHTRITDSDSLSTTQSRIIRVVRRSCTASASCATIKVQGLFWRVDNVLARYRNAMRRARSTNEPAASSTMMSPVEKGKRVRTYRACRELVVRLPSWNNNLISHFCVDIMKVRHSKCRELQQSRTLRKVGS